MTSVLGIVLAVTLIFGETISLELQSGAVIQHQMEKLDFHFEIYGHSDEKGSIQDFREFRENISGFEGVRDTGFELKTYTLGEGTLGILVNEENMYTNVSFKPKGLYGEQVFYPFLSAPNPGEVIMSQGYLEAYGLKIGQQINISFSLLTFTHDYYQDREVLQFHEVLFNRTVSIAGIYHDDKPIYRNNWDSTSFQYIHNEMYFNGDDFLSMVEQIRNPPSENRSGQQLDFIFSYHSFLHEDIYLGRNIQYARELATDLETEMQIMVFQQSEIHDTLNIDMRARYGRAFDETEDYFTEAKWTLTALSIPMVIFGIYLGYLGIELFLSERRREIGMLKARGATNKQLVSLLLFESLVIGVFAGIIGIVLAGYGSRIIIHFTQAASYVNRPWYDPAFSFGTLFSAILLGMVLMVTSSYKLFKRLTQLDAAVLLSKYSGQQEKPYNASRDVKIVIFSAICLVSLHFFEPLERFGASAGNIILSTLIATYLYLVVPVMIIASPFIVIVIGIRLATRGPKNLYGKISEFAATIAGELGYLIQKNVITGSRRIVNLTTVLSILFAFLILTSTFTHSEQDREERVIRTETGGDIKLELSNGLSEEATEYLSENLSVLPGIELFTMIQMFEERLEGKDYYYVTLILVDADNFSRIAYFDDTIMEETHRADVRSLKYGGAIISTRLSKDHGYSRGDTIGVKYNRYFFESSTQHNIKGVMKALPGLFSNSDYQYSDWGNFILLDRERYASLVTPESDGTPNPMAEFQTQRVLIKVEEGYDHEKVAKSIQQLDGFNIGGIKVASAQIHELRNEPYAGSALLVLRTELGLLIFISLLASGTIVFISFSEKKREIATIMLKGTTKRQLYLLEFGEALVVLIYSIIVGFVVGLISGWVWIFVFNTMESDTLIQRSYWPSLSMFPIIGAMVLIFLVATAVSTWYFKKMDLIKYLRWGA